MSENFIFILIGALSMCVSLYNFSQGRFEYKKYGKVHAVIADRETQPQKFYLIFSLLVGMGVLFIVLGLFAKL